MVDSNHRYPISAAQISQGGQVRRFCLQEIRRTIRDPPPQPSSLHNSTLRRPGSVLAENEDSSRSSTASSSCSTSSGRDDGSSTGTPQHMNQISQVFQLPRNRQAGKQRLLRPLTRSKSSDISKLASGQQHHLHHHGSNCCPAQQQSTITSTATIIYSSSAALREQQQHHIACSGKSGALIESIENSMKPSSSVISGRFDNGTDHPKRGFMTSKSVQKLCRVFRKSDSMNSFPSSTCTSKSDLLVTTPTSNNQKTKELLVHNLLQTASDSPKGGRNLDSPRDSDSPPNFGGCLTNNGDDAQSPRNDTRPTGDYDSPWDMNRRLSQVVTEIINTPKSELMPFAFPSDKLNSPEAASMTLKIAQVVKTPPEKIASGFVMRFTKKSPSERPSPSSRKASPTTDKLGSAQSLEAAILATSTSTTSTSLAACRGTMPLQLPVRPRSLFLPLESKSTCRQ